MPKSPPYIYEKLTWPEINDAVAAGKIPVIPVGSIEQHGAYLPLDTDCVLPRGVALHAAETLPDKILLLPTITHGYTAHVMDFPGTINVDYQHFMAMVADVVKSLVYHGFKKVILINGHGSNMPNLDLVSRRINLETDAECVACSWWMLLTIDKKFLPRWRQSTFPGGCAHACELETSAYLYLDGDNVRTDLIRDEEMALNAEGSDFHWVDLFGAGPAPLTSWTSSYTEGGGFGQPTLASASKGKEAVEEAARQLVRLVENLSQREPARRRDHHVSGPTMPLPWDLAPLPAGDSAGEDLL